MRVCGSGGECFVCCFLSELHRADTFEKKIHKSSGYFYFLAENTVFRFSRKEKKEYIIKKRRHLFYLQDVSKLNDSISAIVSTVYSPFFFVFLPKYFKLYPHPSKMTLTVKFLHL